MRFTLYRLVPAILLWFLLLTPLAANETPYLIVLNKSGDTAWQINAETGEKIKSYKTGRGPHEVAVSPDRKWAVVTNYGGEKAGHTMTLLNLEKRTVQKKIDLSPYTRPHGVNWFRDSRRVIVTSETKQAVIIVDITGDRVVRSLPTGQKLSHMVALDERRQMAYATNIGSGSVSVIDLEKDSTAQPVEIIETGQGTEGLALVDATREGWFSNRGANTISVIDLTSNAVIDTLKSESFPIRLALSPDQKWIGVSNAKSSEITIFNTEDRRQIARIPLKNRSTEDEEDRFIGDQFGQGAVPIGLTFSDTGGTLFVSASKADKVAVINTKTWEVARTINTGIEPDGIAFFRK